MIISRIQSQDFKNYTLKVVWCLKDMWFGNTDRWGKGEEPKEREFFCFGYET